jgi:hypothetical protein
MGRLRHLVCILCCLVFSGCGGRQVSTFEASLAQQIEKSCGTTPCAVDLNLATPFAWDTLYVFSSGVSHAEAEKETRQTLGKFREFSKTFVFLHKGAVVRQESSDTNPGTILENEVVFADWKYPPGWLRLLASDRFRGHRDSTDRVQHYEVEQIHSASAIGQGYAQEQLSSTEKAINDLIYEGLPFNNLTTLADFEKKLGKPRSANRETIPNSHSGNTDLIHYLSYDGLALKLYESTRDRKILVWRAEVSNSRWKLASKIQIGSTRTEVARLLGKGENRSTEWEYGCSFCGYPDSIRIRFSGDKVAAMTWNFNID